MKNYDTSFKWKFFYNILYIKTAVITEEKRDKSHYETLVNQTFYNKYPFMSMSLTVCVCVVQHLLQKKNTKMNDIPIFHWLPPSISPHFLFHQLVTQVQVCKLSPYLMTWYFGCLIVVVVINIRHLLDDNNRDMKYTFNNRRGKIVYFC